MQLWPDNNIINIYEIVIVASLMDNCNYFSCKSFLLNLNNYHI